MPNNVSAPSPSLSLALSVSLSLSFCGCCCFCSVCCLSLSIRPPLLSVLALSFVVVLVCCPVACLSAPSVETPPTPTPPFSLCFQQAHSTLARSKSWLRIMAQNPNQQVVWAHLGACFCPASCLSSSLPSLSFSLALSVSGTCTCHILISGKCQAGRQAELRPLCPEIANVFK